MNNNNYPADWNKIAKNIKNKAGWKCEDCKRPNDTKTGYVLTVHHINEDKSNCKPYNLIALCQRCHLKWQGKKFLGQLHLFKNNTITIEKWEEREAYINYGNNKMPCM